MLVAVDCVFKDGFTFDEMCKLIFSPYAIVNGLEAAERIKFFRRYRHYIVGISGSLKNFCFVFCFSNERIAKNFKKEFKFLSKEAPE